MTRTTEGEALANGAALANGTALVIGEALVDVVRRPDGTEDRHPGGSPANVAIGLARLGRPTALLTSLAADADGDLVRAYLSASGVRLDASPAAARTSAAVATLDAKGAATYGFDLEWTLGEPSPIGEDVIVVHTGSVAATLDPGAYRVATIVEAARPRATITYDPNVRPSLMGTAAQAALKVERILALADVVKASDEDLAWLYPGVTPEETAASWLARGPAVVVVTQGGAGVFALSAAGRVDRPALAAAVVDTVGAGDSFMGALIDGLWAEGLLGAGRRASLHAIDAATLGRIVDRCLATAAITVSRAGANPPWRHELASND